MRISNFSQQNGLERPSIDYYAFRSIPYQEFQALQVIYALYYQLLALPFCSDDIEVIRHKTRFWLGEIHAAYQGSPQHPVTQDLQQLLASSSIPQKEWVNIITAIDMQIDCLLLEKNEEVQSYADRLYGSIYRLIIAVLNKEGNVMVASETVAQLALARTLLSFLQAPDDIGVRVNLSDVNQARVYTLFEQATQQPLGPLTMLAKLYQHQAKEPMVKLGPLKTLWLSICERLSSTK